MKFVFFGTPDAAIPVLETLKDSDYLPELIVCAPDKPVGRKQVITPPPTKTWAEKHNIPVLQPERLSADDFSQETWDLFVVFAYGNLLAKPILEIPKHGVLNIHPSLLPELRGPSPVQTAILQDKNITGVTIMQMDEKMDHGPIINQEIYSVPEAEWPIATPDLEAKLVELGSELLVETIPAWLGGEIEPQKQAHEHATYTQKIDKKDGELELDPYNLPTGPSAYEALLKVKALAGWPETYFLYNNKRIKIKDAVIKDDIFFPTVIVPEGKNEMKFEEYFTTTKNS